MGYTWAQFATYLRLAQAREASARAADLVVANHAFAGGDGARKLLQDLQRRAEGGR
ncbi:MAG: hypothetical protein AMXMBFR78_33810 [Rubrivivax sp.]